MPFAAPKNPPTRTWAIVTAIAVAGLILRIAAGAGGLWVDEAWSVRYAQEATGLVGVFTQINHDNNHHLNSLWLQLVGPAAPPLVMRGLAILTGTLTIFVAAAIGGRRGPNCAWVTATLFAVAEVMVTYGSEARGYAPMLLAFLIAFFLVDCSLEEPDSPVPAKRLALVSGFGALAHLTMFVGVIFLGVWTFLASLRRTNMKAAIATTAKTIAPAAATVMAIAYLVALAAANSATGFQIGGYSPFSLQLYSDAMGAVIASSLGASLGPSWLLPTVFAFSLMAVTVLRPSILRARAPFYLLAAIGFPLIVLLVKPGNSEYARYYLISVVALLLVASEMIAAGLDSRGARKWAGALLLVAIVGLGFTSDLELIRNQRGSPDGSVATMAALQPSGSTVILEQQRPEAVLSVAAVQRGYRLVTNHDPCTKARFYYLDQNPGPPPPMTIERCGNRFSAVASGRHTGLSGVQWALYSRESWFAGAPSDRNGHRLPSSQAKARIISPI